MQLQISERARFCEEKQSEDFCGEKQLSEWVIRKVFTQVKFINDSNLSPATIDTIGVPANENETVTKKHMLLLPIKEIKALV